MEGLIRIPRAFDPERGQEAVDAVPALSGDAAALVRGAGGSSPYLKSLIVKEADWLPSALDAPKEALATELKQTDSFTPDQVAGGLRQAKRRVALLTALMDLGGIWPLEEVTGALTDFADRSCQTALRAALSPLIARGKVPGLSAGDEETGGGVAVIAMGKMGAHELNYSSDIDLICLFDETRFERDDFHDVRAGLVRAVRQMCKTLSDVTAEGYVFRTDLRLRPDPAVTPVVVAMEMAERYYESLGRTWERAAFIKARVAAGDITAGNRFLKTLRPFVWRRHLDFAAIRDAHDMRLAIREHKGTGGPITLPGHHMKLGRGGIREIEFFTQTQQLISGGRDESLRVRGTVEGLAGLAARDWVPEEMAARLSDHYRFHRMVEHRLQMVGDAQTHSLPRSDEGFAQIAAMMDYEPDALKSELRTRLEAVHGDIEGFFVRPAQEEEAVPDPAPDITMRWPSYPALRSARGREIFERLKPDILRRLSQTAHAEQAIRAFDGFLEGLPAGVQVFSLFEANPQLIDLIVDIVGTAPVLGQYLARNAGVLDAVIGGAFWADWPGTKALCGFLADALAREDDYERKLDAARRWAKEWHFRIGVHHLRGLTGGAEAGAQYAGLAEATVAALWPEVIAQFARKHGEPPGRGAMVLAMGSLGAGRLNARSDLDLIVIYDPGDQEQSNGPRPLLARPYYARLTQALVTALTAPMAEGRLYEVDMRLRPSGTQGPVATSWASFENYQRSEAWVWEHLALTRARVVAGNEDLAADVESLRRELLGRRARGDVLREVATMRARIFDAKAPDGPFDAKIGPGRMQDIELIAQAGTLIRGVADRDVQSGLAAAESLGLFEADLISRAYDLQSNLQMSMRLLSGGGTSPEVPPGGGTDFVLRETGAATLEGLTASLVDLRRQAAAAIEAALEEGS